MGIKWGKVGIFCVGKNKKHHYIIVSKNVVFFITAIHIFSILISAYDLKFSKAINLTSISNSSHIVVVCSICINIYHDFLLFEIFDLLFKCNHLCFSFFRLLFLLVLSRTPSFLFCSWFDFFTTNFIFQWKVAKSMQWTGQIGWSQQLRQKPIACRTIHCLSWWQFHHL